MYDHYNHHNHHDHHAPNGHHRHHYLEIPSLEFSVACCHSLARPDPVLEEEQMSLAFLDNSADNDDDDDDENDGDDYDDDLQMCNTDRHTAPSPPAS